MARLLAEPRGFRPADWLVCKIECIPGEGEYTLTLPVAPTAEAKPRWAEEFAHAERRQPHAAPAPAAIGYTDETVEIRLPVTGSSAAAPDGEWTFFPLTPQVVSNTAAPHWVNTPDGRALVLPKSDYFVTAPDRFEFLLARDDTGLLFSTGATTASTGTEPAMPGLLAALGLALLGGLMLNLMPCVFPILFLKAAGAIEVGGDRGLLRRHGVFCTIGVVVSFLAMSQLLAALVVVAFGLWLLARRWTTSEPKKRRRKIDAQVFTGDAVTGPWYARGDGHGSENRCARAGLHLGRPRRRKPQPRGPGR